MRPGNPRGSTLLVALGVTVLVALIIVGVLTYPGAEQGRSGRAVRDMDAQSCVESAAQWGRKYYGERYTQWNDMLSGALPGYNNPEATALSAWGEGSYGRIDGQPVSASRPADFRVTLSDNVDEFPPATPEPGRDNDLQVVLRAECLIPSLALPQAPAARAAADDPYGLRGRVLSETSTTRTNRVLEVVLIHIPMNEYKGQRGGGSTGDQNVFVGD